jgi:hypothetical protein
MRLHADSVRFAGAMSGRHPARPRLLAVVVLLASSGCAAELDMAQAYDSEASKKVSPTTIEYAGVKEATRQYGDYGSIRAAILVLPQAPPGKKR